MAHFDLATHPHRRFNPLTDQWVLVSPHRTKRPWQGLREKAEREGEVPYDPQCYLCPGNRRAGGEENPRYSTTHVFTNDFAALLPEAISKTPNDEPLLIAEPESGICRVICYSPRHDLHIARMPAQEVEAIIAAWQQEYRSLGKDPGINHVQIFENRGLIMGCSNPHPHGQIWANQTVPPLPAQEAACQAAYLREHGDCLLCRYLATEISREERVVLANGSFVALVPFWAVWPFEILILPRQHAPSLLTLTGRERQDLAQLLIEINIRYDNLFACGFPYTMGVHQQATDGREHSHWHWHIHYFPPLLRSQSVRKHMVGYEMLAMPQRDISPESAADRLRSQSSIHYLEVE